MKKILRVFRLRAVRNIIPWVLVLYFRYNYDDYQFSTAEVIYNTLLGLLLACLLYLNNLVLIPRLLMRKRVLIYIPLALALVAFFSVISTQAIRLIKAAHPTIDVQKIIWIPIPSTEIYSYRLLAATHFVFLTLLTFVFTLCWYFFDYQKKQKELTETQKKQMETELAFLKNQLNPHFLFNTLNNLYGLAIKKSDDTADSILKLSVIMRYVLYESNKGTVSFEKEKSIMEAYIELERLRLNTSGFMNFVIEANKDYNIPPLLWMPVLENTFKHGARFITEELYLEFRCVIKDDVLTIASRNKYNEHAIKDASSGIGMANLEKRLSLLYPGKYTIKTTREGGNYSSIVTIQLTA